MGTGKMAYMLNQLLSHTLDVYPCPLYISEGVISVLFYCSIPLS